MLCYIDVTYLKGWALEVSITETVDEGRNAIGIRRSMVESQQLGCSGTGIELPDLILVLGDGEVLVLSAQPEGILIPRGAQQHPIDIVYVPLRYQVHRLLC